MNTPHANQLEAACGQRFKKLHVMLCYVDGLERCTGIARSRIPNPFKPKFSFSVFTSAHNCHGLLYMKSFIRNSHSIIPRARVGYDIDLRQDVFLCAEKTDLRAMKSRAVRLDSHENGL